MTILLSWLIACAHGPSAVPAEVPARAAPSRVVLKGGTVVGVGLADVEIVDGVITAVGDVGAGGEVVDVSGRFLAPAFVDAHVHLAYAPRAKAMLDGGVAGVVDLASPESWLSEDLGPLRARRSGPMITADGGYPVR